MSDVRLVSYAQNGEDVVLHRALGHLTAGVYVDVGGWDPDSDSVTRLFYERGWRGLDIEPVPDMAARFAAARPRNEVAQVAISDDPADEIVLHRFGTTGLSTTDDALAARHTADGREREDITVPARRLDDVLAESTVIGSEIHFLKIDVEGAEGKVLRSVDLRRWRPWVLVVEATEPNSTVPTHEEWEPLVLDAGYTFTLFDGLSRFYVSPEHPELRDALSYPACVLDDFTPVSQLLLEVQLAERGGELAGLTEELRATRERSVYWRNHAVGFWADAVGRVQASQRETTAAQQEAERARRQLAKNQATVRRVREERDELRGRVQRLKDRVERLRARVSDLESAPQQPTSARGQLARLLRRGARA